MNQAVLHRALPEASSASLDSSGYSMVDERDLVWSKLQVLKDKYFQEMRDLYNMLSQKSTQVMPPEQLSKLHHYKEVRQRMLPYLTVPKERVPMEFNLEKLETFDRQIVSIMETFKRRKPAQSQQTQQGGQQAHQGQQTLSHQPGLSSQIMQTQVQLQQLQLGVQTQSLQQQQHTLSQLQHQDKQGQQPNGGHGPQQNLMNISRMAE